MDLITEIIIVVSFLGGIAYAQITGFSDKIQILSAIIGSVIVVTVLEVCKVITKNIKKKKSKISKGKFLSPRGAHRIRVTNKVNVEDDPKNSKN